MKNLPIEHFPFRYGKYELLERLGSGGMAEVFLARNPGVAGFEKTVVIKRILPGLANDPRMEESFVAEATLNAHVHHKNVVQVFELDRLDSGEFFMTMEYVRGTDLARMLRSAARRRLRIPPWLSAKIVSEVLDALAFVHDLTDREGKPRNLVHRDVTPSNIFISTQGDVKLGDFGVAKDYSRASSTVNGELKGKVSYMSPEQLYRRPVDRRTDIFAAGVVLWECLTQRRLFGRRPEIETMNLICSGPRMPPSKIRRDISAELDRCSLRALQADPDARYQNARGFQRQLLDTLEELRPGLQPADLVEAVEAILGDRSHAGIQNAAAEDQFDDDTGSTNLVTTGNPVPRIDSETGSKAREYSGTHRFWAQSAGTELGPLDYFDLLATIRRGTPVIDEISSDRARWSSLATFVTLTGQEALLPTASPPSEARSPTSIVAALAELGLDRGSGVLSIGGPERKGALPAEIELSEGKPVIVRVSSPQLQLPDVLVQESVLKITQVPIMMHRALATGSRFEDVVAQASQLDAESLRTRVMKRRLAALLEAKPVCRYRKLSTPSAPPFSSSILTWLPGLVRDSLSTRGVQLMLARRIDAALEPTPLFADLARFELSPAETAVVEQLATGKPIRRWMAEQPESDSLYLYLGYTLLEAKLLAPKA